MNVADYFAYILEHILVAMLKIAARRLDFLTGILITWLSHTL